MRKVAETNSRTYLNREEIILRSHCYSHTILGLWMDFEGTLYMCLFDILYIEVYNILLLYIIIYYIVIIYYTRNFLSVESSRKLNKLKHMRSSKRIPVQISYSIYTLGKEEEY